MDSPNDITQSRSGPANPDHISEFDREHYSIGYDPLAIRGLSRRSVYRDAAFFLPHLRSGMDLLDCGCGPGTITVDMAEMVSPGNVVGIDIEASQFQVGRTHALERGISNIRFELGNAYEIPFSDGSFDAVFAHAVLYHLSDPSKALKEIYRVLRPGGIVGVRDTDRGGHIFTPSNPMFERAWVLIENIMKYKGSNLYLGRTHRALLRETGFVRIQASASYDYYGTTEATQRISEFWEHFILKSHADLIINQGWADKSEIEGIGAAIKAWGEHPDAFFARARCEALGWKE
jgi:ubiquinone/menaquinone biosynthesis C-methylase UbiE